MPVLEQIGMQLGGALLGQGMGMLNDQRQIAQNRILMQEQEAANKRLFDYTQAGQYNMWRKTGPVGMMKEYKAAGLNPALAYGTSGAGGTTGGGSAGSVTSASASGHSGENVAMAAMGMQMQQVAAQTELTKAQTKNVQAQTAKTEGVDTANVEAQTASLTQGITNQKAVELLTKAQTKIAEAEAEVKGKSIQDSIDIIAWQTGRALHDMEKAEYETRITRDTMQNKINIVRGEMLGVFLRNALTSAQTEATQTGIRKTETEISAIVRQGVQKWTELRIAQQNADAGTKNASTNEWVNDMQKSTGLPLQVLEQAVDGVMRGGKK